MAGLLDFLQSASNSAASNVSAPVDGLAWLLRKAGVPVPSNPLLGSDWMAEKGLTRPVAQSGASLVGETAGLLAPMLAVAKAPQIASGLLGMVDNLSTPSTLNKQAGVIKATFKESPNFRDKVSILDDGTALIEKRSAGFSSYSDYSDRVFQAAMEKYAPKYDHFFRFTNNKNEVNLANQGALKPSMNHADNFAEAGVSVADGPHYGIQGYKYGYPVKGDVIGYGSDGEPLLNPKTLQVMTEKIGPARQFVVDDKLRQAQILKDAGLPEDYLNGVHFTNDMYSFKPR